MADIVLPSRVEEHYRLRKVIQGALDDPARRRCPAADIGEQADGNHHCRCKIQGESFTMESNPLASLGYCLGEYDNPTIGPEGDALGCPVWLKRDDAAERVRRARDLAAIRTARERQITSGMRVDDDGVERRLAAEAAEARAGVLEAERTAAMREAIVRAHWEEKRDEKTADPERPGREPWRPPGAGAHGVRYRHYLCAKDECRCEGQEALRHDGTDAPGCAGGQVMVMMRGMYSRQQALSHFPVSLVAEADGVDVS